MSAPPSSARAAAHRILVEVEAGGSSSLLLERARFASPAERALATELVLGSLRRRSALDALLARVSARPLERLDPPLLAGLRLGAYQLRFLDRVPAYAAVGETVEVVKRAGTRAAAAFANGVLRALARVAREAPLPGPDDPDGYLGTTLSLPPFLAGRWRARYGLAATLAVAEAAVRPAAVTLRAVRLRGEPAELARRLAAEGVPTAPGRHLDEALAVAGGSVLDSPAFREGLAVVQDEAAQMVARLVAPRPGERLLDACAAPGGKSVALADLARGGALLVAADRRPGRLRLVRANLERTRASGVRLVAADAAAPPFRGAFDRVLVDAPCTGTGTLRRNPELRYRADAAALARSRERALAIAAGLLPLVAPGGRLVWATCSLEPEENDDVVAWLRSACPALAPVDPRPLLPESARRLVGADLALRTQPGDPELDGFTAFVLERRVA